MLNQAWKFVCVLLLAPLLTASAEAAVPGQFIGKMYAETLGRAPDPSGWSAYVGWFQSVGCNQSNLKTVGLLFYDSGEYANHAYDKYEKVLTLYRGVLSREPDPGGYRDWVNNLQNGWTLHDVAAAFLDSAEFAGLVNTICAGGAYGGPASIGFGGVALGNSEIPTYGSGFSGNQTDLQNLLYSKAGCQCVVLLKNRAVIVLTSTLVIPNGVALATDGGIAISDYAKMARLVRGSAFSGPMVQLSEGNSKLWSVWVSGQRHLYTFNEAVWKVSAQIVHFGGSGGQIGSVRSDTPYGWSMLQLLGDWETQVPCSGLLVNGNLFVGYTSNHSEELSDGITNGCNSAEVVGNGIVDPTDVGIVVFDTRSQQQSWVHSNTIVTAGRSAYGGIVTDVTRTTPGLTHKFGGTNIEVNSLMSSPTQHFDVALHLGTKVWTSNAAIGYSGNGQTVRMANNTVHSGQFHAGLVVDGMIDVTATGNVLNATPVGTWNCPVGSVFAHPPTDAGGTIQAYTNAAMHDCLIVGL